MAFTMKALTMDRKLATAATLVVVLAAWLLSPVVALAHSRLLNSSPVAGTVLDTPPQQIAMSFSEPVGLEFSAVNLYDRARNEIPLGTLSHGSGDSNSVAVDIPSKL